MKTNKILVILVIVLIIVNIATISFFWLKDSPHKKRMHANGPPKVERFLKRKLNLSEKQLRLFREARKVHFQESRKLMNDMKGYRKQLLFASGTDDLAVADSLFLRLSAAQSDFERLNFEHMKTLRGYCDQNQQIAFDSVMTSMFDHLSNPERRRLRKQRSK